MANLKDIKTRITSVKKTRQITQAMKLVAGAKLKRATDAATNARPYQENLAEVLQRVAARAGDLDEPLLAPREEVKRIKVVVLTSDRGLCGGFNNSLLRRTLEFLEEKASADLEVDLKVYGRKGATFLPGRGHTPEASITDWQSLPKMELVRPLADELVAGFIDGDHDEVYLAYNAFKSTLVQEPTFLRLLPLSVESVAGEQAQPAGDEAGDYRYEPGAEAILGALLPLYLRTLILQTFLETDAGMYAAQMTAMDAATRNASDLIEDLSLEYNRARQAAITTEIIEIVSGAEAL